MDNIVSKFSSGRAFTILTLVIVAIVGIFSVKMLITNVDASSVVVIQSPISGNLTVHTDPGWKWRGFGSVTTYPRREQFSFSKLVDQGKSADESIQTRFNDGGHGSISGVINWTMPLKPESVIRLHKDFHGFEAIEQMLIRPTIQKVIYNVGPTMSSTESSAERRPDIPKYIDDQLVNGPYLTKTVLQTVKDPITGQDKQANVVIIAMDAKGKPERESESVITAYGIGLQAVTINAITYDEVVEDQIKQRQTATTQVQIAIANARKAEQEAITTAKQGEANAAKAKWEQETVNAKEIALAEKDVQVATQKAKAAEQFKKEQVLIGEGEASRKRLVMEANGALDVKLSAYVEVNKNYADAIANAQPGAWTPSVVMGQGSSNGGAGAQALVEMLTAKTARELGIDMSVTKGVTKK